MKGGKKHKMTAGRVVLSAKMGRPLEPWEQACHIDGNPLNNSMENLRAGDLLNNSIDCISNGTKATSPFYIEMAIKRLRKLLH